MTDAAVAAPATTTGSDGSQYTSGAQGSGYSQSPQSYQQQQTPQYSQQAPQQQPAWYQNIQDPDLRGYVQNKGWPDPVEAIKSYRNLEKMNGMDKVVVPKDLNDHEGWDAYYAKGGRPDSADGYQLPVPEGDDGTFAQWGSELFHKAGLNVTQARYIAEAFNEYQASLQEEDGQSFAATAQSELNGLQREWGPDYDNKMAASQSAAQLIKQELGWGRNEVASLERAVGTRNMMSLMNLIGERISEDRYVDGGQSAGYLTAEGANSRINDLSKDRDFQDRYQRGEASAVAEFQRLMRAKAGRQ